MVDLKVILLICFVKAKSSRGFSCFCQQNLWQFPFDELIWRVIKKQEQQSFKRNMFLNTFRYLLCLFKISVLRWFPLIVITKPFGGTRGYSQEKGYNERPSYYPRCSYYNNCIIVTNTIWMQIFKEIVEKWKHRSWERNLVKLNERKQKENAIIRRIK